jgi:murein DD-endopeptidase MepM/ murein hydrolase activator NlpD
MLLGPGSSVPRPAGITTLAAALIGLAGAATASAATGGAAATPSPSAPSVSSVVCRSGCGAGGAVAAGGTLTLRGQQLDRATALVFLGAAGSRDDVRAPFRAASPTRADVKVPAKARSGRIALVSAAGVTAQAAAKTVKVAPRGATQTLAAEEPAAPTLKPVKGIAQLDAGIAKRRVAKKGVSAVTVAYVSHAPEQTTVRVDVVRSADGVSVFSDERTVAAEQPQTLSWNGRGDGTLALDGKYAVRIATGAAAGARTVALSTGAAAGGAAPAAAPAPPGSVSLGSFTFAGAVFPVRGAHNYGQGAARFGAGRAGHSHEGQDVLAQCGTPVVAARGGIVKMKATHAAAGNYVVVSDASTGQDHAYMHFRAPALVDRGDTVETGQLIGYVGDTGSASACHLHFEIWTAPGWYEGGRAIDPLATLKRWDKLG